MVETFTQEEMIKAMYHELSSEDMFALEMKLEKNAEIENNFDHLNVLRAELNKILETPSDDVIQNILQYSITYKK